MFGAHQRRQQEDKINVPVTSDRQSATNQVPQAQRNDISCRGLLSFGNTGEHDGCCSCDAKILQQDPIGSSTWLLVGRRSGGCEIHCHCDESNQRFKIARMAKGVEKYANIRFIGFLLFIAACIFCLYKIYEINASDEATNHFSATYTTRLKLVSAFNRHGDRAPSDSLPSDDPHASQARSFWPYGLSNLTTVGRFRQFRVGLELRNRYNKLLDYNASHILALSSPIYRCQESLSRTLKGLFDIETTVSRGRRLAELYNLEQGNERKFCFRGDDLVHNKSYCEEHAAGFDSAAKPGPADRRPLLPGGEGFPLEYRKVKLNLKALPTLTWQYLNTCKWRIENPTPVDKNLLASEAIAKLKGVNKLARLLKSHYKMDLNFTSLGLWSSISNEILLARTRNTIAYSQHYLDWLNTPLPEYAKIKLSLYDLWEQVVVLGYRDRIVDTANYIQTGPIITSLIKSQSVALGQRPSVSVSADNVADVNQGSERSLPDRLLGNEDGAEMADTYGDSNLYRGKKMIIYSTHDSILQLIMFSLGLIQLEPEDFETRFVKWHKSDDVKQLLAGYKMSKFGLSLVFELYETERKGSGGGGNPEVADARTSGKKLAFIQVVLYNQEDGKFKPVEYKRLKFGAACQRMFRALHKSLPRPQVDSLLAAHYDPDFPLDRERSCPFELFKRITSALMIQPAELSKLCDN